MFADFFEMFREATHVAQSGASQLFRLAQFHFVATALRLACVLFKSCTNVFFSFLKGLAALVTYSDNFL